jgi:hypothetical protein
MPASIAHPAWQDGAEGHPVPDADGGDQVTHGHDVAGRLVAHHQPGGSTARDAEVSVNIRPADPGGPNRDDDVARAGLRVGSFVEGHLACPDEHQRSHQPVPTAGQIPRASR